MARAEFIADQWDGFFRNIDNVMQDPIPVMKTAYSVFGYKDIMDHFDKETGITNYWKPSKRALEQNGQTLQDTGNLRNSVPTAKVNKEGKRTVSIINTAPYSGYHDEGLNGHIQREFMWLSDDAQGKILDYMLKTIIK